MATSSIIARGMFAACSLLVLAACADLDTHEVDRRLHTAVLGPRNVAPVQRNKVLWTQVSHRVNFVPGSAQVLRGETATLDAFFRGVGARPGEHVVVTLAEDAATGRNPLLERRIVAIRQHLASRRVVVEQVSVLAGIDEANAATISVSRLVAATPDCPTHNAALIDAEVSPDRRHFGCLSAQTLGAMVERPSDLLRGRDLGRGDGNALAKGVLDYRTPSTGSTTSSTGSTATSQTAAPSTTK